MIKLFLFILLLPGVMVYVSAQSDSSSTSFHLNTLSTWKPSPSGYGLGHYTPNWLSGGWVTFDGNKRIGISSYFYFQENLPIQNNEKNYDVNLFFGWTKSFLSSKRFEVYSALDVGLGHSRYDYLFEDESLISQDWGNYFMTAVACGLKCNVTSRITITCETKYALTFGVYKSRELNMNSGDLVKMVDNRFSYLQYWLPLSALGVGFRI